METIKSIHILVNLWTVLPQQFPFTLFSFIFHLYQIGRLLSDDDDGRVGRAGDLCGHHRGIHHPQPLRPNHPKTQENHISVPFTYPEPFNSCVVFPIHALAFKLCTPSMIFYYILSIPKTKGNHISVPLTYPEPFNPCVIFPTRTLAFKLCTHRMIFYYTLSNPETQENDPSVPWTYQ